MIKHEMKLNTSPFNKIKRGCKIIEIRLFDEKRSRVMINDIIRFLSIDDSSQWIEVKVIGLHKFASFKDLFTSLSLEKCGNPNSSVEIAVDRMHRYYTLEKEKHYGVLGIEFIVVTNLSNVIDEKN